MTTEPNTSRVETQPNKIIFNIISSLARAPTNTNSNSAKLNELEQKHNVHDPIVTRLHRLL